MELTQHQADAFARMPLTYLRQEYPNHIMHLLNDDGDVLPPRELHPIFYGCFDWHSAVHGYWLLLRCLRLWPELPCREEIIILFEEHLTDEKVAKELAMCSDLGFSDEDRKENIRRVGEVASLMADAGLVVLTAFISPHRAERQMVRERVGRNRFIEVFVDTPLAICEARDPKGLYKKARAGELRNFTGIDSVYEAPESPEIHLEGQQLVTNLVSQLLDLLRRDDIIRS